MTSQEVEEVLAKEVRPFLMAHGGDVQLVSVTDDGKVKVKLVGACAGCPGARLTLENVVEEAIKAKLPEVKEVEAEF